MTTLPLTLLLLAPKIAIILQNYYTKLLYKSPFLSLIEVIFYNHSTCGIKMHLNYTLLLWKH